jgi:uncharacterized protein (DUF2062 family)
MTIESYPASVIAGLKLGGSSGITITIPSSAVVAVEHANKLNTNKPVTRIGTTFFDRENILASLQQNVRTQAA